MRDILVNRFGFASENVSLLVDRSAIKARIWQRLHWLFQDTTSGDHIVFHFSGHGSYIRDFSGDERESDLKDEVDELICLYDMDWRNRDSFLIDDKLGEWARGLPKGVNLTVIVDACHSGDVMKLVVPPAELGFSTIPESLELFASRSVPHGRTASAIPIATTAHQVSGLSTSRFVPPPVDIAARIDRRRPVKRRRLLREQAGREMNHVLLAGCRDDQTSADAWIGGSYNGAFTYYLCEAIRDEGIDLTYEHLIGRVRASLDFHGYSQVPQCEGPGRDRTIFS